jgi:hypothetical protein
MQIREVGARYRSFALHAPQRRRKPLVVGDALVIGGVHCILHRAALCLVAGVKLSVAKANGFIKIANPRR